MLETQGLETSTLDESGPEVDQQENTITVEPEEMLISPTALETASVWEYRNMNWKE